MQDRQARLAPADHVAILAYQDPQDHQAHVARLVQWGLEDHQAKQHRGKQASLDLRDSLVHLGPRVRKVRVVRLASEARPDSQVHQAPEVSWDRLDPRDRLASPARLEDRESAANRDRRDPLERQDLKDHRVNADKQVRIDNIFA